MREPPNIAIEHLQDCLQREYGLSVASIEFLPLGLDVNAGVYRVESDEGAAYLLKVRTGARYEPAYRVPEYLRDWGIDAVVAPLPTTRHALWAESATWTLLLYPFIVGETGWRHPITDAQWASAGETLRQIHQASLPDGGFPALRRETFDPSGYIQWMRAFEAEHLHMEGGAPSEQALRASWVAHQSTIETALEALASLGNALRERSGAYVICHADLHPGNMLRDSASHVYLIDWEDVMLAPKERDFIFIGEKSPFYRGYGGSDGSDGAVELDWVALTYYRWERGVQDLIECAKEVFFQQDVGDITRAEAARLFEEIFAPGDEVDAAIAAASHLPPHLTILTDGKPR